jgi:hypothetical protein
LSLKGGANQTLPPKGGTSSASGVRIPPTGTPYQLPLAPPPPDRPPPKLLPEEEELLELLDDELLDHEDDEEEDVDRPDPRPPPVLPSPAPENTDACAQSVPLT